MRFWTEAQVRDSVSLPQVIDSVQEVLAGEAAGTAWNIDKTMATWPEAGSAHALGAVDLNAGLALFKVWANTPTGASALMTLFSTVDGATLGIAEAGTAGMLRTAAVSGVATRFLAAPDAAEMALLGSGRQALLQVAAVAAVRPLERVRVWSRTAANARALADRVRAELGIPATPATTAAEATDGLPIVTLVTRARDPFLRLTDLAEGAHLNAVGAILPANAEFEPQLLADAALVVVDSEAGARRGSRELREHGDWTAVHALAALVAGKVARPDRPRVTVFKGMGMGLSDLAVARILIGGQQ